MLPASLSPAFRGQSAPISRVYFFIMDAPRQRKRQLQEVDEKQREKQATRGQSVAAEIRIPPLPGSDARINPDPLDSFPSPYDADPRPQKLKQQKIALPSDTRSDRDATLSTIPQCQLCQRVARALHPDFGYRVPKYYEEGRRDVKLGSWGEILRNENCPTCSRIAELFNTKFQSHGNNPRSAEYEFWLYDYSSTYLRLTLESKSPKFEQPFISIDSLARGISDSVGVLMDQCWIDFGRVLQWIKSCNTMHAECHCNISALGASFSNQNMFLISVSKKCLVKANGGEKYVALSYVWGAGFSQFRTTKANLTLLQSEGSLRETRTQNHLPGTIQRAMHFTSLLDVEFLWVDCLCIVQDDPIHAASQINSMANIYLNSYLTLCAADGVDAASGLLGIRQCSPPRNVQQDILAFADGPMSSKYVKYMPNKVSVYDERGWTFQEQVLSRRILSFTGIGLKWRCQEVSAEEQKLEVKRYTNNFIDSNIVRADTLWPCLKKWDNLVFDYLRRRLTYEEDILRAFSGILESLSSSMLGGFLFGLPQQFFDAALLWVPKENLIRREDMKTARVKTALPSWSWAGWTGARESQINAFGLCHERSNSIMGYTPRIRDIYPSVTWFKTDMETLERVKIPNDYARFRENGLDGTIKLPLGWSWNYDEDDRSYYYKYENAPPRYTFWYPIPTGRGIQPASNRQWEPILNCKTFRGYLEMGSPLPQQEDNDKSLSIYSLYTGEGTWAGIIYVHQAPESPEEQNQQCELVLISGGWAIEDVDEEDSWWLPEWLYEHRPRSGDFYEFYHVLWIEWQDNIAYRRGLARVVKKVWDDLPKEEIDLYLG